MKDNELSNYVNNMLNGLSIYTQKNLSEIIIEYQNLNETLRLYIMKENNYQPLKKSDEDKIYEASAKALFNHYIK